MHRLSAALIALAMLLAVPASVIAQPADETVQPAAVKQPPASSLQAIRLQSADVDAGVITVVHQKYVPEQRTRTVEETLERDGEFVTINKEVSYTVFNPVSESSEYNTAALRFYSGDGTPLTDDDLRDKLVPEMTILFGMGIELDPSLTELIKPDAVVVLQDCSAPVGAPPFAVGAVEAAPAPPGFGAEPAAAPAPPTEEGVFAPAEESAPAFDEPAAEEDSSPTPPEEPAPGFDEPAAPENESSLPPTEEPVPASEEPAPAEGSTVPPTEEPAPAFDEPAAPAEESSAPPTEEPAPAFDEPAAEETPAPAEEAPASGDPIDEPAADTADGFGASGSAPFFGVVQEVLPLGAKVLVNEFTYHPETQTRVVKEIVDGQQVDRQEAFTTMVPTVQPREFVVYPGQVDARTAAGDVVAIDDAFSGLQVGGTVAIAMQEEIDPAYLQSLAPETVILVQPYLYFTEEVTPSEEPAALAGDEAAPHAPASHEVANDGGAHHGTARQASLEAIAALRKTDSEQALATLESVTESDSEDPLPFYVKAYALHASGKAEEAEEALKRGNELERKPITAWYRLMEPLQGPSRAWLEEARRR